MNSITKILYSLLICSILIVKAKGELSGSLADFDKAVKLKPDSVDAYIGRGKFRYKQGDPNSALADYKKAIELKPDLCPAPDMAQSPDFTVTNDVGLKTIALIQAKEYEKLDELAKKYRSSKERYADGVWKLSSVYDALIPSNQAPDDDWDARLDSIARWTVARPDSITARVAWANLLVSYAWKARGAGGTDTVSPQGWRLFFSRLAAAEKCLKESKFVIDVCPIYWRVMMTDALGLQMPRPQFDALFEKAIKFEPDCETYYYRRAIYLLPQWYGTKGEWQSDLAKSADKIGGENGEMLYSQVVWNMHIRYDKNPFVEYNASWPRVDKGFEVIEKYFPNSLGAKIERANLAILANDARAAIIYNSGKEKQAKGDLTGAMIDYNKAIEIKTNYVYAYVHLGILNHDKGDLKSAMADYNKAIEIDPNYSTAYYNRGVNKQSAGEIDGAMADFTRAIELRPNYALAYMVRGQLKQIKGDKNGAMADFIQANKIQNVGK